MLSADEITSLVSLGLDAKQLEAVAHLLKAREATLEQFRIKERERKRRYREKVRDATGTETGQCADKDANLPSPLNSPLSPPPKPFPLTPL